MYKKSYPQDIHRLSTKYCPRRAGTLGTPTQKIGGGVSGNKGVVKKRRVGVESRKSDEGNSVCVARGYRARIRGVAGVGATRCGDFFDGWGVTWAGSAPESYLSTRRS